MTDDDGLDRDFAALRVLPAGVPGDLMGRILADAARLQPAGISLWRLFGGWKAAPALLGAAAIGLGIGYAGVLPDSATTSLSGYDMGAVIADLAADSGE